MTRRALIALVAVATIVVAAAWVSAPGVGDLPARLAARERATGARPVPLPRISLYLREALVATEDERFYRNHGIDVIGLARAIPYDVTHLSFAQGGSTLTDQLAKLLYLHGNDHSPWRKLEDLTLALRISTRYSKEEVLAAYLNSAYFGDGAYGVRAAAERYFGVPPARLDLAQSSLLAGLVQAPSAYNPLTHPVAARWRQVDVLRSLVRTGDTTSAQAEGVLSTPLRLRGGSALAPLTGVTVASLPAFALGRLATGVGLLAVALLGFVVLPRTARGHRSAVIAVRVATLAVAVIGAITISGSINTL